jgi:hypothetical protein
MKIVDFKAELTSRGEIAVPPEIAAQVPPGEQIQIRLQWGLGDDESAWRAAGRRQFEEAYCADDSIYEQLIHDAEGR